MIETKGLDVFLLGAGRPARGHKPSALKHIARNTRAMDWQVDSFADIASLHDIHFLGGYHAEEVMHFYPEMHFTILPDWEKGSILQTFLSAPFSGRSAVVVYSDTIFHRPTINSLSAHDADIVLAIDSHYATRYQNRSGEDIAKAEIINLPDGHKAEFTGLAWFSAKAVATIVGLRQTIKGSNLLHLVAFLQNHGLKHAYQDIKGDWAELNSPIDIARFILGTKAETLSRLKPLVRHSTIADIATISQKNWQANPSKECHKIQKYFPNQPLAIRSSATAEDGWSFSHAGGFETLLNIPSQSDSQLEYAITKVFASYGSKATADDHVLVQPMLDQVASAGVIFTCTLETGAPYYRINMDDSGSTSAVTAGESANTRSFIIHRNDAEALKILDANMQPLLDAVIEIEQLLGYDKLDIECAIDKAGKVHLFQVRPVAVDHSAFEVDADAIAASIRQDIAHFSALQTAPPHIVGDKTLFGNMPDWNPAEIIGTRPKPLAISLYQHLIVNHIWARQRAEYGYRNIYPHPLIVSFSGQPYVDIRASLNSFIPAQIDDSIAAKMVNGWLDRLITHPFLHDKIEFEIASTIWTPDFADTITSRLKPYGITQAEIKQIEEAYKQLTRNALVRLDDDTAKIAILAPHTNAIMASPMPPLFKAYHLLEIIQQSGTLPFAHAARAGFVAASLLRAWVADGAWTEERRLAYLRSIPTIASQFEHDKHAYATGKIPLEELTHRHGHLRPGTYDITAKAYWEDANHYFAISASRLPLPAEAFSPSEAELAAIARLLNMLDSPISPQAMLDFCARAIQARESVKHAFSRTLSMALDCIIEACTAMDISRQDAAFLTTEDITAMRLGRMDKTRLKQAINLRQEQYRITQLVELPCLITHERDFTAFERMASQPNFITRSRVEAEIMPLNNANPDMLADKIIAIPRADPGYDWLFSHPIAGLITQYGGANSHMAIRAAEIGLPAAIGVGDAMYEQIIAMQRALLDCAGQTILKLA